MPPNLPRVLAGPIVRRVESTACSFWIALSEPAQVTAAIWTGTRTAGATPGTVADGEDAVARSPALQLRKFGENLFIGVITVPVNTGAIPPLTPGSIYSYDLILSGLFGESGLKQERLLQDEQSGSRLPGVDAAAPLHLALGYIPNRLPSFVASPATVQNLRLAHTSCRKSNGEGPDALAWLDDELAKHYTDEQRVQQLFLTGDQIYADDVGACLLPMLNGLGRDFMGTAREERLPVAGQNFDAIMPNFPALRRAKLVRDSASLTSTSCDNHLLSFAEFAAMYLAAWSPRVWRGLTANNNLFSAAPAEAALHAALTDWEACFKTAPNPAQKWQDEQGPAVNADRARVEQYRDAVPHVARALANVATYMICDDHEITDDWNLNKRWRNRVYSRPLGKAIVRNGMAAYGLFQGWGNDPAEFERDGSPNKEFLTEVQKMVGGAPEAAANLPVGSTTRLEQLLTMVEPAAPVKWHYRLPGPRHLVLVMDSRTRRKYRGEGIAPPSLLGDTLNAQIPAGPLTDGRELLIVVSPAPVLGPTILEKIGAPLFEIIGDFKYGIQKVAHRAENPCEPGGAETGAEAADAEGWGANEPAREELLNRLATYGKAILLSGDVHYGLSMELDHWTGANPAAARIIQLTSSPARNNFSAKVEALLRSNALLQRYEQGLNPELLAWSDAASIQLPAGAHIGPGRRARMRRKPALVTSRGWPNGTTIPADKGPNWRWRLKLVRDQRPEGDLPLDAPRLPLFAGPELNPGDASSHLAAYRAVAARHQTAALTGAFFLMRQLVFATNIGLIDILNDGAALAVRHTLLSHTQNEPFKGVPNTVHQISLAPTADPAPVLQVG